MNPQEQQELIKKVEKRVQQKKYVYIHFGIFALGTLLCFILNRVLFLGYETLSKDWWLFVAVIWLFIWLLHFINVFYTKRFFNKAWEQQEMAKLITKHNAKVGRLEKKLVKSGVLPSEATKKTDKKLEKSKGKNQKITLIAAIANSNALGKDNKLIWHLPADLKRFKSRTSGHHIIMGRKTFDSIGKPLPNRTTVIITRDKNYQAPEGCIVVHSIADAIDAARNDEEAFIIGGAQIYSQALAVADKLDITHVHHSFEADAFFPVIDSSVWKETFRQDYKADEKNKYDYSFVTYERI